MKLKKALARELSRHPRVVAGVAGVGRTMRVTTFAERLEAAGGLVVLTPPAPRAKHLRLLLFDGTDQIAEAFRDDGWQAFEAPLPDVFVALARRRAGLVLDVGANSGFYALLAASVAPGSQVHAFEPFPPVIDALWSNIRLNHAERVVTVVAKAVGDEPGVAQLFVPDAGHGRLETSASLNSGFSATHAGAGKVEIICLDDHVEACGSPPVALLKIDVESMEHKVLAGAERLLARDRPPVVVEVLPVGEPASLEELRQRHGYLDVRLRPGQAVIGGEVAFDPDAWNHLWVPASELDEYVTLLEGCGLSIDLSESARGLRADQQVSRASDPGARSRDTSDAAYTRRLAGLEGARWKQVLDVQCPYRWNLRRLDLGRTLDVGCGLGRNLAALAPGSIGIDHNPASVAVARARGLPAMTPEQFEESTAGEAAPFDSLLLAHVIEHMDDRAGRALLERYIPCLRPGGTVVLICPQERGYASDATHVRFVDFDDLVRLAEEVGLHVDRRYSFPFPRPVGRLFPYNEFVVRARLPALPGSD